MRRRLRAAFSLAISLAMVPRQNSRVWTKSGGIESQRQLKNSILQSSKIFVLFVAFAIQIHAPMATMRWERSGEWEPTYATTG